MHRLFAFICLLAVSAYAQDRASINGAVTDPSGALVAGAAVDLRSAATGLRRAAITDQRGIYEITPLPVGRYTLNISKAGFRPTIIDRIDLRYGETRTLDASLAVGTTSETVEVTATAEAVNRTNAEVGGVIESAQIKEIPVSGRNWASLMLLAPGAINYGDGAQRAIRFNGHSLDDSNFTFDGIDTSGVQEQTQKADTRLNIALDSIAEFRVSTAVYTAESGRRRRRAGQRGIQDRHQRVPRQRLLRGPQRRSGCPLALRRRHAAAVHAEPVRRQLRRRRS